MIRNFHLKNRSTVWLVLIIISLIFGYWGEMLYMKPSNKMVLKQRIEYSIHQQRFLLEKDLDELASEYLIFKDTTDFISHKKWHKKAEGNLFFWIFKNDSLVYWNGNKVVLPELGAIRMSRKLVRLPNALGFLNVKRGDQGLLYVGFLPVEINYPIENQFVKSAYNSNLGIPESTLSSISPKTQWSIIKDDKGQILFYLDLDESSGKEPILKGISLCGYGFALLFMFLFWADFIRLTNSSRRRNVLIMSTVPLGFFIVWLIGMLNVPNILYETTLFSPEIFGMPGLFGNLGSMLIFSLFWFGLSTLFNQYFIFGKRYSGLTKILILLLPIIMFHELVRLYLNLVGNSVIIFEINKLSSIDVYSFVAQFILLALFGGWYLFVDRLVAYAGKTNQFKKVSIISGGLWLLIVVVYLILGIYQYVFPLLIGGCLLLFAFFNQVHGRLRYSFFSYFFLTALIAVLGVTLTWNYGRELKQAKESTLLINRASGIHNEHDPYAEMGLIDIHSSMQEDAQLKHLLTRQEPKIRQIEAYLRRVYFKQQWKKYDVQVIICWPESELNINNADEHNSCYTYFQEMISETGEALDNDGLFYLNNKNGRISYFIWDKLNERSSDEFSLFIDIESRLTSIGSGYPELVRDLESETNYSLDGYSFARYVDGILISYSGDYPYNISSKWLKSGGDEFSVCSSGGFKHLVYQEKEDELFVLSKPDIQLIDLLLYLLYLFLFLFALIVLFVSLFKFRPHSYSVHSTSLEARIRGAILFILLFSFVLVGFASVYYNVKQYKSKQVETLKEKTRSVLVMLDQVIGESDDLHGMSEVDLTGYLRGISNSLYVDINVYDQGGLLVASSRPEIFEQYLQSREMNPMAYNQLTNQLVPWSLQNEYLGSKEYLSAYKAIYSWNNHLLGYINLPHFVSSDEASKDLSDFIVLILNIYLVFVLIAILLTIVLARQITKPLQVIKEKLSGFRLRERNEKINYNGKDEIGSLVNEYNRLVDELESGAEQLASTERTSAWREMARQIAHEIKNPLTPMKLSIQHLQRAKHDNHVKFDEFFQKTTLTLVEQIDNLSKIATEFSSFSKMTASHPERLNLFDPVRSVVDLFKETENIHITFNEPEEEMLVWADKEQLIQVFNNLMKNASQAIPLERKGTVIISFERQLEHHLVIIKDNGTGIAEEVKAKLFEPNFTTKRTGMGIGLAISRNIIHSFNGDIWFEQNTPEGTVFFVKLPKYTFS